MKKLLILSVIIVGLVVAGCGGTGGVNAGLNQEFSLSIGQSAVITGKICESPSWRCRKTAVARRMLPVSGRGGFVLWWNSIRAGLQRRWS
ncbi:hypothetical protein ACFLYX_03605 [Chloroflexota bacterium]